LLSQYLVVSPVYWLSMMALALNVKLAQRRTVPLALWDNQTLASLLAYK